MRVSLMVTDSRSPMKTTHPIESSALRSIMCINILTYIRACDTNSSVRGVHPLKKKALLASGTLNPSSEAVHSKLFELEFFDPYDRAQVKYEMLRAHVVDEETIAEACRQFGFSRESFYQIQQAFKQAGFSSLIPAKRGRKGATKLKGEILEFALERKKENPDLNPGRLAALITERYGIPIHRTTVVRGIKKKLRAPAPGLRDRAGRKQGPGTGDL
jgi:transposase